MGTICSELIAPEVNKYASHFVSFPLHRKDQMLKYWVEQGELEPQTSATNGVIMSVLVSGAIFGTVLCFYAWRAHVRLFHDFGELVQAEYPFRSSGTTTSTSLPFSYHLHWRQPSYNSGSVHTKSVFVRLEWP